ncbi:MAG: hypothetical protein R3C11_13185 [Planctomycetaceae bacterium]
MFRLISNSRTWLAASLIFCAGLVFFAQRPLWHTDLWGHLSYGRMIWNSGQLPTSEPWLLIGDQREVIDTAWLSQLLLYGTETISGTGGLQLGYALTLTLMCLMIFLTAYQLSQRMFVSLLGTALFLWLEWEQFKIIRPQLAGSLFYVLLCCRFQLPLKPSLIWWLPPILLLWANLHGSFIMGLGLTGALSLTLLIISVHKTHSLTQWSRDPSFLFSASCS